MKNRAVSGTRTRDPRLGKPMLYQLSYYRRNLDKFTKNLTFATTRGENKQNLSGDKSFFTFSRLIFGNAFQQTRFENKERTRCSNKNYGIKQQDN